MVWSIMFESWLVLLFSRDVNFQYVWREFWEYDGCASQLVRSSILQTLFATPPFTMPKAMKLPLVGGLVDDPDRAPRPASQAKRLAAITMLKAMKAMKKAKKATQPARKATKAMK